MLFDGLKRKVVGGRGGKYSQDCWGRRGKKPPQRERVGRKSLKRKC